jgi:hypothetical protein
MVHSGKVRHQLLLFTPVSDPSDPRAPETGFPSLQWEDEELETRPLPLTERPLQAQIDYHMAVIAERHIRIALAIEKFWGHSDCVEYIRTLILNGGYADGTTNRVGFKHEVLSSLIQLVAIHESQWPATSNGPRNRA